MSVNILRINPSMKKPLPSPSQFIPTLSPLRPFNNMLNLGQRGISQLNTPADMNSAHYLSAFVLACLDLRAATIARYPLVGIDNEGIEVFGPKVKRSQRHYLYRLLRRPNPVQDEFQFRYLIQRYLDSLGNCVVYLDNIDPRTDLPGSMWPLDPARCEVAFDEKTSRHIGYMVKDEEGREFFVKKELTIHFKTVNPNNLYWGEGRVQMLAKEINLDAAITEYISQYFNQGATTSGYLTTDETLSEESFARLCQESAALLTGLKNAWRLPVLESGTEYKNLGTTLDKLGVEKLQDVIMKKLLTGFLIPGTKFGLTEFSNYKAEDMEKSFLESMLDLSYLHMGPLNQLAARFDKRGRAVPTAEMEAAKSGYMSQSEQPKGISIRIELPPRETITTLVSAAAALAKLPTLSPEEKRATTIQLVGQFITPTNDANELPPILKQMSEAVISKVEASNVKKEIIAETEPSKGKLSDEAISRKENAADE